MSKTIGIPSHNARLILQFAVLLAALLSACALQAQTFSVLYAFQGDARAPMGTPILDRDGNLYGTTQNGGRGALGSVYKLDPQGTLTLIYSFTGDPDGANPVAGVVMDANGNLYGATPAGGLYRSGTVFRIDDGGHETVLHSFQPQIEGMNPQGGVTLDSAGNLYGTTAAVGTQSAGTIFKITSAGAFSTLYTFKADNDGKDPRAGVLIDGAGNLIGTTRRGGHYSAGAVFKLDTQGKLTILYSFPSAPGGRSPYAPVIRDAAGNLFGTTADGGAFGEGSVYKLDTQNRPTVLYSFSAGPKDGQVPRSAVVRDAAGNLYGTTLEGGTAGQGTVYKVDPAGKETILHNFTGGDDGGYPYAGLVMDNDGNLYGAAAAGGVGLCGTIFKITTK